MSAAVPPPSLLVAFSPSPCAVCHASFIPSPIHGRRLVATSLLPAGSLILREACLLQSSWDDFRCFECGLPHSATKCALVKANFPPLVVKSLTKLERRLADIEGIDELDRARCLLKCFNEFRLRGTAGFLGPLLSLTGVNKEKCEAAIATLVSIPLVKQSGLFPAGLSQSDAALLLAILNTNSHQLSDIGGSGIFLRSALAEHSCAPNATFTCRGGELSLFALTEIPLGGPISIDYGNFMFYSPTAVRRSELRRSHGFHCLCDLCENRLVDRCRAFKCPAGCGKGFSFPGPGDSFILPCSSCGGQYKEAEISMIFSIERAVEFLTEEFRNPPDDAEPFEDSGDEEFIDFKSPAFSFDKTPETNRAESQPKGAFHSNKTQSESSFKGPLIVQNQQFQALEDETETGQALEYAQRLVSFTPLDRAHWLVFHVMERIGREFAGEASQKSLQLAEGIFRDQLACLRLVIQLAHHEEFANALDCLAQVLVAQGPKRIAEASQLFSEAARLSALCLGEDSADAQQLRALAEKTPRSTAELQSAYDNFQSALAEMEFQAEARGLSVVEKTFDQPSDAERQEIKQIEQNEENQEKGKKKKKKKNKKKKEDEMQE